MSRVESLEPSAPARWLSIVGIGEDGVDGLSPAARRLIQCAKIVFGGKRHLRLAAALLRGAARPWPSPFAPEEVLEYRNQPVCVLASGDPFMFGVGSVLARHVGCDEMIVMPAASAFSLAAARLGWSMPDTTLISLHARALDLVRPHLHPQARLLALTSDGAAPAALAALLTQAGFGGSRLIVLERLGGPHETIRETVAARFDLDGIDPLNTVALEIRATPGARVLARAAGLNDAWFEHDGQLTKREIRAVTLSALAPRRGELLWDVGAGAGSVGIEWMLADPSLRAIAVEARADRAARIARNAAAFGVPWLSVVEGTAPMALAGLPRPQAIFVGGGGRDPGVLDAVVAALAAGGRLVANAVTLATEAALLARHATLGGDLVRLAVSRAGSIAGTTGWRPALPVTQWVWTKP
jgi:precorrin-6B C5,15-methyltransferase / cobalt-precorrin-6B C5,C15-methyltransferase